MKRKIFFWVVVVMIVGSGAYGAVSDHVLKIEMSSTYNYGFPGDSLYYEFDAWIQIDETVVSGSMQAPDGTPYTMVYESDGVDAWLGVYIDSSDPSMLDDFGPGTYIFTVIYEGGLADATSVDYQLPNGDPIPYVTQQPQFVYPVHDEVYVPLDCTLQFYPAINPDHTIDIWIEPVGGTGLSYNQGRLAYDTSSYGPVTLSPDVLYEGGYSINHYVTTTNADGIPAVMDTDAEAQIHFTTMPAIEPLSGWIWMVGGHTGIGYSLDEGDLLYFHSFEPVLEYNITTGQWVDDDPVGWIYTEWPFYYVLDPGYLIFVLPPESGLWVYHFSTGHWTISPRIIP